MDDYVLTSNISTVTVLGLSSGGVCNLYYDIYDLTGIEDFIALETFGNEDMPIFLYDFSNNKKLKYVHINLQSPDEIEIDLSQNLLLERFLSYHTNFTSIDLTNNVNLKMLGLEGSSIISLDLSQNTALTHCWILSNQLTSLDLKNGKNLLLSVLQIGSPNLTCVEVDDPDSANDANFPPYNYWHVASWTTFSEDCGY